MTDVILTLEKLSKTFRSNWTFKPVEAVKNISLEVFAGESFGFLGHNGAGKTTVMKMITGLIKISQGRILLAGQVLNSPRQHSKIGYLPELPYFYDHLTVEETLDFFARLHGLSQSARRVRIEELLTLVKLSDRKNSVVRSLSKGLQQRLGLAQAIINRPQLLLLDEPFSGLDPMGRVDVRELVLNLKREGTTIFLSSHVLSDVQDICDRVSIMSQGQLKAVFPLAEIPSRYGESFSLKLRNPDKRGESTIQQFEEYGRAVEALHSGLSQGQELEQFERRHPSLEEIFVAITKS